MGYSHHSADSLLSSLLSGPPPNNNFELFNKEEFWKLFKEQKQAKQKVKLQDLKKATKQSFQSLKKKPAAKYKQKNQKDQIAIERAKNIKKLNFYSGKSQ